MYGTTGGGGAYGYGTVFKIKIDGSGYEILHSFSADGNPSGGLSAQVSSLVLANNYLLYGTTYFGGANSNGMLFGLN